MPVVHVRVWHSSSVPGHSVGSVQPTHAPLPLQTSPLPHGVVAGNGGFDGTPALHRSSVHGLPSTGTSLSSSTVSIAPAPSHWSILQSPALCAVTGTPAVTNDVPHCPATHVAVT